MQYFFNVRDGRDIDDDLGIDLPDLHSARVAAVQYAGAVLRDYAAKFWDEPEWRMEVSDQRGLVLFTLTFYGSDAASIA